MAVAKQARVVAVTETGPETRLLELELPAEVSGPVSVTATTQRAWAPWPLLYQVNLCEIVHGVEIMTYRDLDTMHDFVHEIYPAE